MTAVKAWTRVACGTLLALVVGLGLAVTATTATAPSAAAAQPIFKCEGDGVRSCVGFELTAGAVKGVAKVVDRAGGYDYQVWVNDLRLYQVSADGLKRVGRATDRDGRKDVHDFARTGFTRQRCAQYVVRVNVFWKRKSQSTVHQNPNFERAFRLC